MPQNLTNQKSTLVQVMAWCHQATSHYLSQMWPISMSPYGVTSRQWVKSLWFIFLERCLRCVLELYMSRVACQHAGVVSDNHIKIGSQVSVVQSDNHSAQHTTQYENKCEIICFRETVSHVWIKEVTKGLFGQILWWLNWNKLDKEN